MPENKDKKFLLKDILFNEKKVLQLAIEIHSVYPEFDKKEFIRKNLENFPVLELKQRIYCIRNVLKELLPVDFRSAATILLKSLPTPVDKDKTDNDFGDFIYAPYSDFIANYGCIEKHLQFSLRALKEITTRFSAEDAIRYFINAYPDQSLRDLNQWTADKHYHVRRLCSEGTRPKLPWSQKLEIPIESPIPILDQLYFDKTRFVTRSVANHLNDISKLNPELVISTLKRWKVSSKQDPKEMEFIIKHSLRTLVKKGDPAALKFLGFAKNINVTISNFRIKNRKVILNDYLEFEFQLHSGKKAKLVIDYSIYFRNKSGQIKNKKVFKLKKIELNQNESRLVAKRHRFISGMTTRQLYPGKHSIEIQVNGMKLLKKDFELIHVRPNSGS